jgi:Caudovirus prohead serine protease
MKNGTMSLSFGYMTVKSRQRGGVRDLLELDLYEISIVPAPANPETRILEMKSIGLAEWEASVPTVAELRRQSDRIQFELAMAGIDLEASRRHPTLSPRRPRSTSCASRPPSSASPAHRRPRPSACGPGSVSRCSRCSRSPTRDERCAASGKAAPCRPLVSCRTAGLTSENAMEAASPYT